MIGHIVIQRILADPVPTVPGHAQYPALPVMFTLSRGIPYCPRDLVRHPADVMSDMMLAALSTGGLTLDEVLGEVRDAGAIRARRSPRRRGKRP